MLPQTVFLAYCSSRSMLYSSHDYPHCHRRHAGWFLAWLNDCFDNLVFYSAYFACRHHFMREHFKIKLATTVSAARHKTSATSCEADSHGAGSSDGQEATEQSSSGDRSQLGSVATRPACRQYQPRRLRSPHNEHDNVISATRLALASNLL